MRKYTPVIYVCLIFFLLVSLELSYFSRFMLKRKRTMVYFSQANVMNKIQKVCSILWLCSVMFACSQLNIIFFLQFISRPTDVTKLSSYFVYFLEIICYQDYVIIKSESFIILRRCFYFFICLLLCQPLSIQGDGHPSLDGPPTFYISPLSHFLFARHCRYVVQLSFLSSSRAFCFFFFDLLSKIFRVDLLSSFLTM